MKKSHRSVFTLSILGFLACASSGSVTGQQVDEPIRSVLACKGSAKTDSNAERQERLQVLRNQDEFRDNLTLTDLHQEEGQVTVRLVKYAADGASDGKPAMVSSIISDMKAFGWRPATLSEMYGVKRLLPLPPECTTVVVLGSQCRLSKTNEDIVIGLQYGTPAFEPQDGTPVHKPLSEISFYRQQSFAREGLFIAAVKLGPSRTMP